MPTWGKVATNLFKSAANTLTSTSSNSLQPGSLISVGDLRVQVIRQLAEGGFAFVYQVKDVNTEQTYALKRLLVNDAEDLSKVKEEIEFMVNILLLLHYIQKYLLDKDTFVSTLYLN